MDETKPGHRARTEGRNTISKVHEIKDTVSGNIVKRKG
jgi:hypothetical protein